ncbi:MAG: hypothetical protein KAU22_09355, partial [Desulfuromonadales bacterium]|nr:hypothetical protein [Desulfuromonadales bacterium]
MTEIVHLQQFAQQLATWTEAIIEHGRTPFRRVDTYPDIDTEMGTTQPPLVFWINRQSMMAGGVLLLPDNNLEAELVRGRNCAAALGLSHFITWETDRVRIWQSNKETTLEQQSFPLSHPEQPETFRNLLADVLEALKLLAVIGATPAPELPTCYFNNLFHITLQQTLPPLIAAYRSQRYEAVNPSRDDADICAKEASQLILLRLLTLIRFNLLPDAVLPEKLEQTIKFSLTGLPDFIREPLARTTIIKPPSLPLEAAVCLHHLLLRLHQLAWNQTDQRAEATIKRLIDSWYLPASETCEITATSLYPEKPLLSLATTVILSNSAAFLAATAILTEAKNHHQCQLLFGNLFQLEQSSISMQPIYARLLNLGGITNSTRHEYSARLRTAWPNRHLKIKTGQPFWRWELIHLLGISHPGQILTLDLPLDLLQDPDNQTAWDLIYENFSLQHVWQLNGGNFKLQLVRSNESIEILPIQLATELRKIIPVTGQNHFRSQLLLALALPTAIHNLLGNELVWPDGPTTNHLVGWKIYSQSRLYMLLRQILQYKNPTNSEPHPLITE